MASKKKTSPKKAAKKTAVKKKPAVKKTSAEKTARKKSTKKTAAKLSPRLTRLTALAATLSNDEVDFLISQAETMVRNRETLKERQNRLKNREKVAAAMNPVKDKDTIEIIEGEEGRHFIIVLGAERNFFSRDEMKKIVKLCHAAEDERDGMRRLYTWLDRFRGDVLRNNDISGTADTGLLTIYKKIISTYTTGN